MIKYISLIERDIFAIINSIQSLVSLLLVARGVLNRAPLELDLRALQIKVGKARHLHLALWRLDLVSHPECPFQVRGVRHYPKGRVVVDLSVILRNVLVFLVVHHLL